MRDAADAVPRVSQSRILAAVAASTPIKNKISLISIRKGGDKSIKKVTYVIPIERKRLTTKWIEILFYKALFMGFQSTSSRQARNDKTRFIDRLISIR